jgi:RNA polymerase sigma-70 factor (ECF subfamily)
LKGAIVSGIYNVEKIWEDFSYALKKFIVKRVVNISDANDILQDVFLKIHLNIDSLIDDKRIKSWVYQIARNTIIDYYRKRKIEISDIDDIEEPVEIIEDSQDLEISECLRNLLQALPEKYAKALYMVEFQGLTQIELAKKLEISVPGAKSRIQRGRKMLKDDLMKCCHFDFDKYGSIIDYYPKTCCCCNNNKNCTPDK